MTKTQKISFAVLSVLLSSIAALSGFMVYIQLSSRQREKDEFAELTELIQIVPSEPSRSDETPPVQEQYSALAVFPVKISAQIFLWILRCVHDRIV